MKVLNHAKMNIKTLAMALVASSILLAGCGGGAADTGLEAKKAQLMTLQNQLQETQKQIMQLEAEIAALDPASAKKDEAVKVEIAPIKAKTFEHFVTVQGQVESNNNVMVSPKMAGVITQVFVKTGQRVSTGQTLAQVDNSVMAASLTELELQLDLATTVFNKQKNLWDQKIGSEIQFLEAKNRKESLEKRIETTKKQIALSRVTSPIAGVVDNVMVKAGEAAMPGAPAFQVVNLNDMKFTSSISEAYIPYVKEGDKVSIEFSALDKTIDAKISSVSQTINPINRTVGIEVKMPRDKDLKANLTGKISIRDEVIEDAVIVPLSLLRESGKGNYVMIAEKDGSGNWVAKKNTVTIGRRYEEEVVIESGLKPGQMLISQGATGLEDGQKIKVPGMESKPAPDTAKEDVKEEKPAGKPEGKSDAKGAVKKSNS